MRQTEKPKTLKKLNVFYRAKRPAAAVIEALPDGNTESQTLGNLIGQGEAALKERNYDVAKILFESAIKILDDENKSDAYLIQRLAYATYKSKKNDPVIACNEAHEILSKLDLEHTNDTETVSLAGRIEKKLFENGQGDLHLARAIHYFERGYFLLRNRYHGINLAFLYNIRADSSLSTTPEDRIADMVWAQRVRQQVLILCQEDLEALLERKKRIAQSISQDNKLQAEYDETEELEQTFWIHANKAEALYGLGRFAESEKVFSEAKLAGYTEWMMRAYEEQHNKLKEIMKKHGNLLNPQWTEI